MHGQMFFKKRHLKKKEKQWALKKKKFLKYLGEAVTEPRQQAFIVSDIIIVPSASLS